jgi:hypothetical protein
LFYPEEDAVRYAFPRFLLAAVAVLGIRLAAVADCIPYCHIGGNAPMRSSNMIASDSGDVQGYFFGHQANDMSLVRMWDVTTNTTSPWVFNNLTTQVGAKVDFGAVNKGDVLVFELWAAMQNTAQPGAGAIYYSLPQMNPDKLNHFYSAVWNGGMVDSAFIPAGTFMGGEDLPFPYNDWDYNDNEFVWSISGQQQAAFENAPVPEPGSLTTMLLAGLGAISGLRRRFRA